MNDSRISRLEEKVTELSTDMKWVRRHLESHGGEVDKLKQNVDRAKGFGWALQVALPIIVSVLVTYVTGNFKK